MSTLAEILNTLIPFRFLDQHTRGEILAASRTERFDQGDVILRQGDTSDTSIYILSSGQVEAVDETSSKVKGRIEPGRYFGERAALLDAPRALTCVASEPCEVARIPGELYVELLETQPAFTRAFGDILREKQGIFKSFDAFLTELLHGVSDDLMNYRELLRRYRQLSPAIHPHAANHDVIDFGALAYAIPRLPDAITSTFMLYLTDNLHEELEVATHEFKLVDSRARRRVIYQMAPGKLMVVLRYGHSDLIDFITCLCSLGVEMRKLRRRIHLGGHMASLIRGLEAHEDPAPLLPELGFTQQEAAEMVALWGDHTLRKLYEIVVHHEDYNIQITKQLIGYNSIHVESWTSQIADACCRLTGWQPSELPDDIDVHIVSSNTHSVSNCLSPFLRAHADEILTWGEQHKPELGSLDWVNKNDLLYATARYWLKEDPTRKEMLRHAHLANGMVRLERTSMTGIVVEIIDTSRIDNSAIDDAIFFDDRAPSARRKILVNIDYAFGQQAEEILAILLALFGARVTSVNILGKAGALVGERGDVLIADSFIEQTQDLLGSLPNTNVCDANILAQRLPDRGVHKGPILTVAGTLLQNPTLLNFYKRIWRCVGLEMEGTFYLRELERARHIGIIRPDCATRFVYYVSDVPLQHGQTLSGSLRAEEGIPPLYGITREVLAGVLSS